jgi:hypothetical protein
MTRSATRLIALALVLAAPACAGRAEPPAEPTPAPQPAPPPTRPPVRPPTPPDTARARTPARARDAAILPQRRIVAFYGNPRSKNMGILGELPPDRMLARLDREVKAWEKADPATPVQPALQVIAVMAAGHPGDDGKYRIRMPDAVIRQVIGWAERRDAIVILDIQPGRSTVQDELKPLLSWLRSPDIHLALDPEWAMDDDQVPGKVVGSLDAKDINHAIRTLSDLVEENGLPPKVLVIHRFTQGMVTNVDDIVTDDPNVQVVLDMDGWGPAATKLDSYRAWVAPTKIPYMGFKLFYKNDTKGGSKLMTPAQLLSLARVPMYIQYQ